MWGGERRQERCFVGGKSGKVISNDSNLFTNSYVKKGFTLKYVPTSKMASQSYMHH
jgi:hypothetical protein